MVKVSFLSHQNFYTPKPNMAHNTPEFDDRNIKGRYDMHDGAKVGGRQGS